MFSSLVGFTIEIPLEILFEIEIFFYVFFTLSLTVTWMVTLFVILNSPSPHLVHVSIFILRQFSYIPRSIITKDYI